MPVQRDSFKPTPSRKWKDPPEKLQALECNFILDGVAVSKQGNDDIHRTNPSINIGIQQYNGARDKHARSYRRSTPSREATKRTQQVGKSVLLILSILFVLSHFISKQNKHSTMMGHVYDRFTTRCASAKYLRERRFLHSAGNTHARTHNAAKPNKSVDVPALQVTPMKNRLLVILLFPISHQSLVTMGHLGIAETHSLFDTNHLTLVC